MKVSATICNHHVYLVQWFMFRCRALFAKAGIIMKSIQESLSMAQQFLVVLVTWGLEGTCEAGRATRRGIL